MLQRMHRGRHEQPGFTMIELLIVIVILGILGAIVVFAVGGVTDHGTNSACKADYKTVESAEEAYFAEPTAGNRQYGTPLQLVNARLLAAAPKLHGVSLGAGNSTYTITDSANSGCDATNDR